ncbi:hypothetical protein KKF64_02115 [Patescibacteria group bacterium]|nr:hypothetical protein [Patescibacteria group bacterium]
MAELGQLILSTLVYFDIFDYPLTLVEIHNLLLDLNGSQSPVKLDEVRNTLDRSRFLEKRICRKSGFFYLRGRDKILSSRHQRYIIAKRKFDYARKILDMLKHIPFTRAIFVCNSLAINNTKKTSDIDLIIVAKKHGVWLARLFSLILLSIMRIRPAFNEAGRPVHKNMKDKICLSVFVDEDHLDFSSLRMGKRDVDFMYWVSNFYPVYDERGLYRTFWNINQEWLKKSLVNSSPCVAHPNRVIHAQTFIRALAEFLLRPFSVFAAIAQKAKFPKQIKELINQDTRVIIKDGLLKFHVNDKRMEHLEMFVRRYESAVKALKP